MNCVQVSWEDEENNRIVELSVDYLTGDSSIEIAGVTPTKVTFLCPDSRTALRSVGVRRETGRRLLARRFDLGGGLEMLRRRLQDKQAEVATI